MTRSIHATDRSRLPALTILTFAFVALALLSTACSTMPGADEATPEKLTPAERSARADDLFTAMDLNGDGFLSREEMTTGLRHYTMAGGDTPRSDLMIGLTNEAKAKKARRKKVKPMDEAEIRRAVDQAFSSQDTNLDKQISKDEFRKIVVEKSDTSAPWNQIL